MSFSMSCTAAPVGSRTEHYASSADRCHRATLAIVPGLRLPSSLVALLILAKYELQALCRLLGGSAEPLRRPRAPVALNNHVGPSVKISSDVINIYQHRVGLRR